VCGCYTYTRVCWNVKPCNFYTNKTKSGNFLNLMFTSVQLFLRALTFVVYRLFCRYSSNFLTLVTIELWIFLTEPQLRRFLYLPPDGWWCPVRFSFSLGKRRKSDDAQTVKLRRREYLQFWRSSTVGRCHVGEASPCKDQLFVVLLLDLAVSRNPIQLVFVPLVTSLPFAL
jgi:hypothetical protein